MFSTSPVGRTGSSSPGSPRTPFSTFTESPRRRRPGSNWPSMPMAASRSTTRRNQTTPTKRSATASWGLFPGDLKTGLLGSIPDPIDRHLPGYLDLVETALYTTAESGRVLVEFTTRGPIRPIPNQEIYYMVRIDDWDFLAAVAVQPDGSRKAWWDAARPVIDSDVGDNRIGLLFDSGELSGHSTSVLAFAQSKNTATGSWGPHYGEHSAVISFPEATSATTDLSRPGSSAAQLEVFHHTGAKEQVEPNQNLFPVTCRVIEVLGDEFDGFAFHSQFRYDVQLTGNTWGHFPGNVPTRGVGFTEGQLQRKSPWPCGRRIRGQWRYAVWTKSGRVAVRSGGYTVAPEGLHLVAHEFTHTWTAYARYLRHGESEPLSDGAHWLRGAAQPRGFRQERGPHGAGFRGARTRTERSPALRPPLSGTRKGTPGSISTWPDWRLPMRCRTRSSCGTSGRRVVARGGPTPPRRRS